MRDIDLHTKLHALWLFILPNVVFRDLHHFVIRGFLDMIISGRSNRMEITQELMLIGGLVVSVPIGMVPLSLFPERKFARPLTFLTAIITTATMVPLAPIDLDDAYHFCLQAVAMVAVMWTAWRWREDRGHVHQGVVT
ncbi:MAG: DUF6326 family protein [Pseudomonadota bacterium]